VDCSKFRHSYILLLPPEQMSPQACVKIINDELYYIMIFLIENIKMLFIFNKIKKNMN